MKYLGGCETGATILYETGDLVEIKATGKRGKIIGVHSTPDPRLAQSTLIEIQLEDQSTVRVVPSAIKSKFPDIEAKVETILEEIRKQSQ